MHRRRGVPAPAGAPVLRRAVGPVRVPDRPGLPRLVARRVRPVHRWPLRLRERQRLRGRYERRYLPGGGLRLLVRRDLHDDGVRWRAAVLSVIAALARVSR